MSKTQTVENIIKKIADNFLAYEFPADMYPDGGISFEKHDAQGNVRKPVGTNLLDAIHAEDMVRAIAEKELIKALAQARKEWEKEMMQRLPEDTFSITIEGRFGKRILTNRKFVSVTSIKATDGRTLLLESEACAHQILQSITNNHDK